jgi:hypothetical protein
MLHCHAATSPILLKPFNTVRGWVRPCPTIGFSTSKVRSHQPIHPSPDSMARFPSSMGEPSAALYWWSKTLYEVYPRPWGWRRPPRSLGLFDLQDHPAPAYSHESWDTFASGIRSLHRCVKLHRAETRVQTAIVHSPAPRILLQGGVGPLADKDEVEGVDGLYPSVDDHPTLATRGDPGPPLVEVRGGVARWLTIVPWYHASWPLLVSLFINTGCRRGVAWCPPRHQSLSPVTEGCLIRGVLAGPHACPPQSWCTRAAKRSGANPSSEV